MKTKETIKTNTEKIAVANTYCMFYRRPELTSLDLSSFNTAAATNMTNMFDWCTGLTALNLSSFNTAAVKNMFRMFHKCSSLTSLDLSSFDTAAVTEMSFMFSGCSGLTSLNLGNFNTAAVEFMIGMFGGCRALKNVTGTISGISVDIDLSSCPLTRESALVFLNGLSANKHAAITLSSTTKALLTEDDIAIATDKGWKVK